MADKPNRPTGPQDADKLARPDRSGPRQAVMRAAEQWAEVLNRVAPDDVFEVIAEAAVEPFWDSRTNLVTMAAGGPDELALVLSGEDGSDDYVLVRYVGAAGTRGGAGGWVVDAEPVDWAGVEALAFDEDEDTDGDGDFDEDGDEAGDEDGDQDPGR